MERNPWLRRYRSRIDIYPTGIVEFPTALSASRSKSKRNPKV